MKLCNYVLRILYTDEVRSKQRVTLTNFNSCCLLNTSAYLTLEVPKRTASVGTTIWQA